MFFYRSSLILSLLGLSIISLASSLSAIELFLGNRQPDNYSPVVSSHHQGEIADSNVPHKTLNIPKWSIGITNISGVEARQQKRSENRLTSRPYAEIVASVSIRHSVDPYLIHALIEVESGYRPDAESPKGAQGLMQLMPVMSRKYGVADPFDPYSNVEAGTRLIKTLLEEFEIESALAAYHAGGGAVRRYGGVPPYPETQRFVGRILDLIDFD